MDKICRVCGVDCSNKPRTKDSKGRYYCKACYEKILRAKKAQAAQQTQEEPEQTSSTPPAADPQPADAPAPAPDGRPKFEGSLLDAGPEDETFELDELVPGGEPPKLCHDCGAEVPYDSVICTKCGFNFQTGRSMQVGASAASKTSGGKRREPSPLSGAVENFKSPGGIAFLILIVFGLLFAGTFVVPVLGLVYSLLLSAFGIVVWIWILIAAFREGIWHGIGSVIIPLYALIFLLFMCDDSRVKLFFGVEVLAWGGLIALAVITGNEDLNPLASM
jgi:hypothetical protein